MRITIACIGRARGDPAQALYATYAARLPWPLTLREAEERRPLAPPQRRHREAELLLAAVPAGATLVALDGRGRSLSSEEFAARIGRWRDEGVADLAFVIGGAEGLDPGLRDRAALVLSLGPMTWPHLLARAMLAEQLYRASAILAGHPYHRA